MCWHQYTVSLLACSIDKSIRTLVSLGLASGFRRKQDGTARPNRMKLGLYKQTARISHGDREKSPKSSRNSIL